MNQQSQGNYSQPANPYQQQKIKKPIYKRWWFWLIIVIVVIGVIGAVLGDEPTDTVETKTTSTTKAVETTAKQEVKEFYGIGETASYKDIEVSLTKVSESQGDGFTTAEDGKIYIFPLFEIANNSNKDLIVSSILSFDAYVDDYAASSSLSASVASDEDTLDGTIAPGKKLKGVYAMEVSENWEKIEIVFEPNAWSNSKIVFEFFKD